MTSAAIKPSASQIGALPNPLMLTYSQYVPAAKVPQPKAKPIDAARRGETPCHSPNKIAGATTASGQNPNGAKARESAAPLVSATM